MSYISFAWTTPAVLAAAKTVTRRNWTGRHRAQFSAGQLVDAYDKSPRNGGRKVATIRLTEEPYTEQLRNFPLEDFDAEGFAYLAERRIPMERISLGDVGWFPGWPQLDGISKDEWMDPLRRLSVERIRLRHELLWVVRFELVDIVADAT